MDRLAFVDVSDSLILQVLQYGTPAAEIIANPLPEDAELVAVELVGPDHLGKRVRLTFRSESFPPVGPGDDFPVVNPGYRRI